jgi:hypothetical protein
MQQRYFLQMIQDLRRQEEIVLHQNILAKDPQEQEEVIRFLRNEYEKEALNYPFSAPPFDPAAASWSSDIVYHAAQLILYREHKNAELEKLFPEFGTEAPDASAILTADLCLRFLPEMIFQLKVIDSQDALIPLLEQLLHKWHYSGIKYELEPEALDFEQIASDPCTMQLYVNRVIEYKKLKLSAHPVCAAQVKSSLGMYTGELWKAFKLENEHE